MKPTWAFLLLITLLAFSSAGHAQQPTDSLRQQANEAVRKLATEISLDDARILQVRRLAYERLVQEKEATQLYSIDKAMQANKMRVIQEDFVTKLKGVTTEAQYNRYLAQHPPVVTKQAVVSAPPKAKRPATTKKPVSKSKPASKPKVITHKAVAPRHPKG